MIKKILSLLPIIVILLVLINGHESFAKSIPDGNARGNNFDPFDVDSHSYKKRWSNIGSKNASWSSGKRLAYDIYSGKSSSSVKKNWQIQTSSKYSDGKQPYLVFWGWSALVGYHHHELNNQATYILAVNKDTGEEKMYKTEQSTLKATKDIEYNKKSNNPNDIYNRCSNSTYNVNNTVCNFEYDYVGFKAWLPLEELFPKGSTDVTWDLYIVKNVEGQVVYDRLIVPFQFSELNYDLGKLDLSSGLNAQRLIMNGNGVIRRTKPRANESGWQRGYFTQNRTYHKVSQNESNTAIWYGVNSPHDSGKTRWASSVYWNFGGDIATLSYEINQKKCPDGSVVNVNQNCQVNVTINHIDANTGKVLRKDKKKATVGKNYSFKAESKGVFKDSDGNPYVSVPKEQKESGKTPNNNMTINFKYKVSLPNPTKIYEMKGSTVGMAEGEFKWELNKESNSSKSRMLITNNPEITGKHYDTRNLIYRLASDGVISAEDEEQQYYYLDDPNTIKDKDISYGFSYEYTNHYKRNYKCVDQQGEDCFEWEFKDDTPVWKDDYKKKVSWNKKIKVDHKVGESFNFTNSSLTKLSLIAGRSAVINGDNDSSIKENVFNETFKVDNSPTALMSQNWIPIKEIIKYESQLDNKFYVLPDHMYYYPIDIDDNLKDKYKNNTPYAYSDYAIPLRIGEKEESKITLNTADNFYLTKKTGLLFSLPSTISSISEIEETAKTEYEEITDSIYDDEVLTSSANGSRYYFNIDPNGSQEPQTWYSDNYVVGKLGLSDVTFHVDQQIQFEKYLVGNPIDNPIINEQQETVLDIEYPHSVVINPEQIQQIKELANDRGELIHSIRSTDINEKQNQLQSILSSLDQ